jgi:predicted transcriptional regulator
MEVDILHYVGKGKKFITKLFINTNINISYKTKNTSCIQTTGLYQQI